jgi:hypothetical protein
MALAYLSIVCLVACIAGTLAMAHQLKHRFPATWQAEGTPEKWLALSTSPASGHVLGFLDGRRYLATEAESFIRFCNVLRLAWRLALILLATTIVVGALWATSAQQ